MSRNERTMMDLVMQPVNPDENPGPQYAERSRLWQGIPTIEHCPDGRLWVAFCSGGANEGPNNYVALIRSDDEGRTWTSPLLVIDPPEKVRAFDPCLWHDPLGRLWLFWAQSYGMFDGRCGVWTMVCNDPKAETVQWSLPRRIANGVMNNKPIALSTGDWLLPAALWAWGDPGIHDISEERYSNVYITDDRGETFRLHGGADVPDRSIDQHMVVERRDGSLWMLVHLFGGIGECFSYDGGKTWSRGRKSNIAGPNTRFFIRRLLSGRLLLVNHYRFTGRNNLTAILSDDDGLTWHGNLLLDERINVSCPDGVQAEDGTIYVVYDRERALEREILLQMAWIAFHGENTFPLRRYIGLSSERPYIRQAVTQHFPEKLKQLFLEFKRLPEGGNYLRFLGMLYELFGQLAATAADNQGKSNHPTPWLKQSIDFMNMHYMEGITVQHVADYMNLHRSYFSTVFTERCSVTPTQYLQQLRMNSAGKMLGESDFTVTEIALSLGYPDLYTFTKAFRKFYGKSPSQFRKENNG